MHPSRTRAIPNRANSLDFLHVFSLHDILPTGIARLVIVGADSIQPARPLPPYNPSSFFLLPFQLSLVCHLHSTDHVQSATPLSDPTPSWSSASLSASSRMSMISVRDDR